MTRGTKARLRRPRGRPRRNRVRDPRHPVERRTSRPGLRLVRAHRRDAPLRHATHVRRGRRHALGAQRRGEHRARGQHADGLLLRTCSAPTIRVLGGGDPDGGDRRSGAAALHAVFSIHLRADQIVSGTAIWFLASASPAILRGHLRPGGNTRQHPGDPRGNTRLHRRSRFFGAAFGSLNLMIWLSFMLVIASYFVIVPDASGGSARARWASIPGPRRPWASRCTGSATPAVVASGVLAGLGGAYLSLGVRPTRSSQKITAGAGVHRARGGDLRQLAPEGSIPSPSAVRVLQRPRGPLPSTTRDSLAVCSDACRTS